MLLVAKITIYDKSNQNSVEVSVVDCTTSDELILEVKKIKEALKA